MRSLIQLLLQDLDDIPRGSGGQQINRAQKAFDSGRGRKLRRLPGAKGLDEPCSYFGNPVLLRWTTIESLQTGRTIREMRAQFRPAYLSGCTLTLLTFDTCQMNACFSDYYAALLRTSQGFCRTDTGTASKLYTTRPSGGSCPR